MVRKCLLAADRLQSPHTTMTSSGRTPVAYTPYGLRPSPKVASMTGFTGQLREVELGCYLLGNGHRVFSPSLMRFFSADVLSPFGLGGVNCYAYCHGDPINRIDPTGQVDSFIPYQVTIAANTLTLLGVGVKLANKKITGEPISFGEGAQLGTAGAFAIWGEGAGVNQYMNGAEGSFFVDLMTIGAPAVALGDELIQLGANLYGRVSAYFTTRSSTPPGSPKEVKISGVTKRVPNNAEYRATTVQEAVEFGRQLLAQQDGEEVNHFQYPQIGAGGQLNANGPQGLQPLIRE